VKGVEEAEMERVREREVKEGDILASPISNVLFFLFARF